MTEDRTENEVDYTSKTVLVVEDDQEIQEMLRVLLTRHLGVRALVAQDGRAALSMAQIEMPDLILMDLMLPVLDGFQTMSYLRALENTRHIPIIVVSNYCWDFDWKNRALGSGCLACFDKSNRIEDWQKIVEQGLSGNLKKH
ncbi:MAG TPA: response regulator [Abditibacteriaceae bacterium]